MWPFGTRTKNPQATIKAKCTVTANGVMTIDVTGQTCLGYLLSVNKAFDTLAPGASARLVTTYSPCSGDVEAYCKARGFEYLGTHESDGAWVIEIRKPVNTADG